MLVLDGIVLGVVPGDVLGVVVGAVLGVVLFLVLVEMRVVVSKWSCISLQEVVK